MTGHQPAIDQSPSPHAFDDRVPVRGNAVVHEVSATDETVIFAKDNGSLLLLNDVGAGIYYLIDGRRTVSDIAGLVQESFPEAEQALDDVVTFLTQLEEAGALRFA